MTFIWQHKFKLLALIIGIVTIGLTAWLAYEEYKVHYERCITKGGTLIIEDEVIRCKLPHVEPPPRRPTSTWKWPWES